MIDPHPAIAADCHPARKQLHEQRRERRKEEVQRKMAELKAKLHIEQTAGAAKS